MRTVTDLQEESLLDLQRDLGTCEEGQSNRENHNTPGRTPSQPRPIRPSGHRTTIREQPWMKGIWWTQLRVRPHLGICSPSRPWFMEGLGLASVADTWQVIRASPSMVLLSSCSPLAGPRISSTQRCCRAHSGSVGHMGCRDWWRRVRWACHMRWSWHRGCRAAWDTELIVGQHGRYNF